MVFFIAIYAVKQRIDAQTPYEKIAYNYVDNNYHV